MLTTTTERAQRGIPRLRLHRGEPVGIQPTPEPDDAGKANYEVLDAVAAAVPAEFREELVWLWRQQRYGQRSRSADPRPVERDRARAMRRTFARVRRACPELWRDHLTLSYRLARTPANHPLFDRWERRNGYRSC